jgi:hypothetical protein
MTTRGVYWSTTILRRVQGDISRLNYTLFGQSWAQHNSPTSFPFRYMFGATEYERQQIPELVFYGRPIEDTPTIIICRKGDECPPLKPLIIQRSSKYGSNKVINKHLAEMERRYPDMCFDVTRKGKGH